MYISPELAWERGRRPQVVTAWDLLCCRASKELGMSVTDLAKKLNLMQPAVSNAVRREEKNAKRNQYLLIPNYLYIYWLPLFLGKRR
jgi:hypothetical protein